MNKFFKGAKAAVGVILAVAVALPTGLIDMVSAASDAAIKNPEDVTLADGVVLSKTAKAVDGAVNTWDVTLRVESPKTSTTSDTVIIIDRSGSMEGKKMSKAKEAAKTLAKQLLPAGNTANRVAVVSFAGDIKTNVGFSDSYTTVAGAVDGLKADGGTYTQAAIRAAADLLGASTANTKNIVLMSDGEPTYSCKISNPDNYLIDGGPSGFGLGVTKKQTSANVPKSQYDCNTRIEDGTSMWYHYDSKDLSWLSQEYDYYNHGNSAIAEAGFYKANNSSLYTVALDAGATGENVLAKIAAPGKAYTATVDNLTTIFDQIAGKINAVVRSAQVSDAMGEGVVIASGSAAGAAGAEDLSWTPDFHYDATSGKYVAEITYRVEATDDILNNLDNDGYAPLNDKATITYNGSNIADFPVPNVKPMTVSIKKQLVGQTCAGCVFDIELTYPGGTTKTYSIKDGETKTIAGGLKMGNYSVNEVRTTNNNVALENYLTNYSQKTFAINKNRVNPVQITVTNTYETTTVSAKKAWDDDNDRDGKRNKLGDLSVGVRDGDKFVAYQAVDVAKAEQDFVFAELPKYRNGTEIRYTVAEATNCANECKEYTGDNVNRYTVRKNGNTITNVHTPEKTTLRIKKIWDIQAGQLPASMPTFITVALSNNENDSVRNIELAGTGYGEWNSDAIEVLKYKNGGELIQYEVKETKIGESTLGGDKKDTLYMYDGNKLEGKWTASYTNAFDVKNTWTPAKSVYGGESEFTIKKIDENGNAMKGVKFDVNTNQYTTDKNGEIKIEIPSVTNVAEDNLRYDIIETKTLEGYDLIAGKETLNVTSTSKWVSADEKTLTNNYVKEYAFVAKNNPGYAWNDGMYIVTNNRSVAESLTVKKVFSGVSAEALKDITFTITGPADFGDNGEMVLKFTDDCEVSGDEATCVVKAKVPTGKYSVKEDNAEIDNFDLETSGDGASKNVKKGDKAVFTIKNIYDVDETYYSVTKVWDDNDDQDGKRPDELIVKLKADGKTIDTVALTADDESEDMDNVWTYTWNELPVANKNGKVISYTVEEVLDSEDYEQTEMIGGASATTFTNTHELELINNDDDDEENDGKLTVTKIWDDGDNELNTRPDAIVVNLYANDKKIESATIMADESGEWKHVFDGLYKYADGEEIVYSVREAYVDGYKAQVEGEDLAEGFTIVNTSTNPCAFGGCGNVAVVEYKTVATIATPETGRLVKNEYGETTCDSPIVSMAMCGSTLVIAVGGWMIVSRKNRAKIDKKA